MILIIIIYEVALLTITLLDGKKLEFTNKTNGLEIANTISKSLARVAYAVYIDDVLCDLTYEITKSCKVEILTDKNLTVVLSMLRHDLAHVMAEAVYELFPNTKFAIGPNTEHGFFYDFLPEKPFKEEDLPLIEKRMLEIINRGEDITCERITKTEALQRLKANNETFKIEILQGIEAESVTFYQQGNFVDLCRGPHINNTKRIPPFFKLTKLSGVYWQGDSTKPMLQRITGISFFSQKDLDAHLALQTELEQYDHRKLGREMDLFHIQEEAVGSVFWHDKGWRIYHKLETYIRSKLNQHNYQEVKTPQLIDLSLWQDSGHADKFIENMFLVNLPEDHKTLAIKPMNCPAHVQIFNQGSKSYKDLPLRMAEFGCCHRNEPSGALHGIMRVRAFTQDDAHIFCTEEHIVSETQSFCELLKEVYKEIFGNSEITIKFSDRPLNRAGDDATWDKAETSLLAAAKASSLEVISNKGEGAFYGPKLEFVIKDSLGRDWQLGTLQVDFILPNRLQAYYIGEDGNKHHPVMLHRAILGSFERFIGILLEHYKGRLPLWLAPIPIQIVTVSNKVDEYATKIYNEMKKLQINVELDSRNKKINYKIREHTLSKVPIIAVIGEKEATNNTLSLRIFGLEKQVTLSVADTILMLQNNIMQKNIEIIL